MMKKAKLFAIFLISALLAGSTTYGQVKIGSNPTSIGANNNLEVEATNGKKVMVKKDVGTVVIENTPPGAITDSIVTVDASGNVRAVSRSTFDKVVGDAPYLLLNGVANKSSVEPGTITTVVGLSEGLRNRATYTAGNGNIGITEPGIYFYSIISEGATNSPPTTTQNDHCSYFRVNGANIFRTCGRSSRALTTASTTTSGIYKLNAGDIVTIALTTASDVLFTGNYSVQFSMYKLSD